MHRLAGGHDQLVLNGAHADDARFAQILFARLELEAFHLELVVGGCLQCFGGECQRMAEWWERSKENVKRIYFDVVPVW